MRALKRLNGKCCYHQSSSSTTATASSSSSASSSPTTIRISSTSSSTSSSSRSYHQGTPSSAANSRIFKTHPHHHPHHHHNHHHPSPPLPLSGGHGNHGRHNDESDIPLRLTNAVLYGLPAFLAVVLYLNTLQAGFVYDDHRAVLGNRDVVGSNPWWWVCTHDFWGSPLSSKGSHGSWRPITTLTFRWNVMVARLLSRDDDNLTSIEIDPPSIGHVPFSPTSPPVPSSSFVPSLSSSLNAAFSAMAFHAFNVILHATVTVTYIGVLQLVGVGTWTCLGAGSLFATHPVHVEAVAGVVGRAELLAALAFCLALAAYINYLHGRGGTRKAWERRINGSYHTCVCWEGHQHTQKSYKSVPLLSWSGENGRWLSLPSWAWLMLSVGGAGVAMACKEQGVTALGVGLMLHAATVITLMPRNKSVVMSLTRELWPGGLGAVILIWLRVSVSPHKPSFTSADNPAAHASSLLTRGLSIAHSWALHGKLLICPSILSFDWSMGAVPLVTSINDLANVETLLLLVILFAIVMKSFMSSWKRRPRSLYSSSSFSSSYEVSKWQSLYANASSTAYHDMLNNNNNNNNLFEGDGDDGSFSSSSSSSSISSSSSSTSSSSLSSPYVLKSYTNSSKRNNNNCNNLNLSSCRMPHHLQMVLGWALLVVPFLPASNLVAYVGFVVAERVLYIPSMGACLLVALGAQAIWHRISRDKCQRTATAQNSDTRSNSSSSRRKRCFKMAFSVAWLVTLLLLSVRTIRRNQDWYSDESLYRSGVHVNPPKALANLGVVYSEQGRLKEAELAYREALRHAPTMADTHYNLGLLLASMGKVEKAIESYHAALRRRPWLAQAHLALAAALQSIDQPNKAIKVLEECRNSASAPARDGWSHSWAVTSCRKRLAHAHIVTGRPQDALEELSLSLLHAPEGYPMHTLHTLTAEAHLEAGEFREAQEVLSRVLAHHPHHVPAHLAFSRMLQANGSRVEEAEQWLQRAVALAPSDPHAHKHLGQLLLEQNRVDEAVKAWLRAAMLDTQDHTAAFNAATALRLAGSNHHAETFYRRAAQLQPQDVPSHRNLGAILHLNGKLEEARKHYEIALTLSPGDSQTTTNLQRLMALVNKKGVS